MRRTELEVAAVFGLACVTGILFVSAERKKRRRQMEPPLSPPASASLTITAPSSSTTTTTVTTFSSSSSSSSSSLRAPPTPILASSPAPSPASSPTSFASLPLDSPRSELEKKKRNIGVAGFRRPLVSNNDASKPRPLIFCGPSGVGKGTLLAHVMKEFPDCFAKSISHTTRKSRPGEIDGVHYHFTDRTTMEASIKAGGFLEHAIVHDNMYGTSKRTVDDIIHSGKIPVLEVDIQGAETFRKEYELKRSDFNPYFYFVLPPEFESLEARLRGRKTEDDKSLARRLKTADVELDRLANTCTWADFALTNNKLDEAQIQLCDDLIVLYPHLSERRRK